MNKLEQARAQIDAIDREMAKLYEARLDAVKDVIAYKIENDLPILDSGREQVVIEKNLQFIQNPDYKEYYERQNTVCQAVGRYGKLKNHKNFSSTMESK